MNARKRRDPMNRREYEIMRDLEDDYWWYVGIRAIARSILEKIVLPGSNWKILDAGCGTGGNFELLGNFGRVFGVEYSFEAVRFLRRRNISRFAIGSVAELPFADSSFDMVASFYVNECLDDDAPAFAEYRRTLKPGGLLCLWEVAFESLRGEHDLAVGIKHRYTRRDLARRLTAAGFAVRRMSYINTLLFPPIFLLRRLRRLVAPKSGPEDASSDFELAPPLLRGVFKATLLIEARLLRFMNLPFGVSIAAVARKPPS